MSTQPIPTPQSPAQSGQPTPVSPDQQPPTQPQTGAFPTATANVAPGAQDQVPSGQVTNTPDKPSLHARIFDQILKGMTGGDIKVVNPDGTVSTAQPSRSSMAKSIVAAALTGLMTPPQYREGTYGPIRDFQASGAAAFQNGKQMGEEMQQKPQQVSDEIQARKLRTLENNSKLLQLQFASSNLDHQRREQSTQDIDAYLKPFDEYNQNRNAQDPATPNAFLFRGADHQEAIDKAKQVGLTEANIIQDGWKPYVNPETHEQEYEPTYAAINPALKNIKLTPEVADRLSAMNSQYANIHEIVGGDVRLPVGLYVSALHDYQALQQTQDVVNRLNKTINGKDAKDIDIAPIVKSNRAQLVPGLYKIQQAVAAGHGAEDGENPANILDVLLNNAPQLLQPLGLTTGQAADKVTEFTAKRTATLQAAAQKDPNKLPASQQDVDALKQQALSIPENQRPVISDNMSRGEVAAASKQIATAAQKQQQAQDRKAAQAAKQTGEWKPGVSADEKKKAELAENMTFNANQISKTLLRRPDLVGAVAGRFTHIQQMLGSDDPDIVALATDIHNIAMANNGIHGMRSAEAVKEFEDKLLNNFKNGPHGIAGGLKGSVDSVQTFIDNARPETYKTHTKQGGAIRGMWQQENQ